MQKMRERLPKLCEHCGWLIPRDISAETFESWRAESDLAPTTKNDYLDAARLDGQ